MNFECKSIFCGAIVGFLYSYSRCFALTFAMTSDRRRLPQRESNVNRERERQRKQEREPVGERAW